MTGINYTEITRTSQRLSKTYLWITIWRVSFSARVYSTKRPSCKILEKCICTFTLSLHQLSTSSDNATVAVIAGPLILWHATFAQHFASRSSKRPGDSHNPPMASGLQQE